MTTFGTGTFGVGTFGIGESMVDPSLIGTPSSGTPVELLAYIAFDRDLLDIPLIDGADSTMESGNSWSDLPNTTSFVGATPYAYAGEWTTRLWRTAATGTGTIGNVWSSPAGSVTADRWHVVWVPIRPDEGATARTCRLTITWKSILGTTISSVSATRVEVAGIWVVFGLVGLAPAGADRMDVTYEVLAAPELEVHRYDSVQVDYLGTEVTSRLVTGPWRRGRNEELGPVQASTTSVSLQNKDGYLTPDSTTAPAPYLGNVDSGRRLVLIRRVDGVLYPEWTGETETWTQSVASNGQWSEVEVSCSDSSRWFTSQNVLPPLPVEIMLDAPDAYLRLDEDEGSATAGSIAGDGSTAAVVTAKYGTGSTQFAGENMLPVLDTGGTADDGQGWLDLNPSSATAGAGNVLDLSNVPAAYPSSVTGWTAEFWVRLPTAAPAETRILYRTAVFAGGFELLSGFQLELFPDGKFRIVTTADTVETAAGVGINPAGGTVPITVTFDPDVGSWGQIRLAVGYSGEVVTQTLTGNPFAAGTPDRAWLGGYYESYLRTLRYAWRTPVAHVAFWQRPVASGRLDAHAVVGLFGGFAESEGNRVGGIADLVGWPVSWTRIDRGLTSLLDRTWRESTALSLIQEVARQGTALTYLDGTGRLVMRNRHYRVNAPVKAVFSAANGTPVSVRQFQPKKDDQYVENWIKVNRTGGGPTVISDPTSRDRYGRRKAGDVELAITSEEEVIAHGRWRIATRKDNRARVSSLLVQAGARPGLFPAVLGLEIGDRVRVENMPEIGPGEILDMFVESIECAYGSTRRDVEYVLGLSPWREDLHQMAQLDTGTDVSLLGQPECKLGWY